MIRGLNHSPNNQLVRLERAVHWVRLGYQAGPVTIAEAQMHRWIKTAGAELIRQELGIATTEHFQHGNGVATDDVKAAGSNRAATIK